MRFVGLFFAHDECAGIDALEDDFRRLVFRRVEVRARCRVREGDGIGGRFLSARNVDHAVVQKLVGDGHGGVSRRERAVGLRHGPEDDVFAVRAARRAREIRRDNRLARNGHRDLEDAIRVAFLDAVQDIGEFEACLRVALDFFDRQVADCHQRIILPDRGFIHVRQLVLERQRETKTNTGIDHIRRHGGPCIRSVWAAHVCSDHVRTAAGHAASATFCSFRIYPIRQGITPVQAPLPHIAMHIIEAPGVRQLHADLMRCVGCIRFVPHIVVVWCISVAVERR